MKLLTFIFTTACLHAQMMAPIVAGTPSPTAGGYAHEYTIKLGNSSQIPSTQSAFPVMVCANLTLGNGNACQTLAGLKGTGSGGYVTNTQGYDIGFSFTACIAPTLLSWETVFYDGTTGKIEAYVKVPSLVAGGTLYVCVGNSAITTFQGGSTGAAWNSSYAMVQHFGALATFNSADSTANANNGANTAVSSASGQINAGASFNGTTSCIDINNTILASASKLAASAWIKNTASGDARIITKGFYTGSANNGFILRQESSNVLCFYWQDGTGSACSSGTYNDGAWHQVVATFTGSVMALYVDAALVATGSGTGILNTSNDLQISGANGSEFWNGQIDEVEVSSTDLSVDWIAAEYHNQSAPAGFMMITLTY